MSCWQACTGVTSTITIHQQRQCDDLHVARLSAMLVLLAARLAQSGMSIVGPRGCTMRKRGEVQRAVGQGNDGLAGWPRSFGLVAFWATLFFVFQASDACFSQENYRMEKGGHKPSLTSSVLGSF